MRSTTHRYRPSRSLESMPRRAIRGVMPRARRARRSSEDHRPCRRGAWPGACEDVPVFPRGPMIGGMASTSGSSCVASWALAAERRTASGTLFRSTTRWYLEPGLPRSTGFGPVCSPPFLARTLSESTLARDQSMAASSPSQLRSLLVQPRQTPAACQSRSRRQQVVPLPQPSPFGNKRHGQPVRSTKTMPASAARSGTRGRPPLGFDGSFGSRVQWLPRGRRGQGMRRSWSAIMPPPSVLQHDLILQRQLGLIAANLDKPDRILHRFEKLSWSTEPCRLAVLGQLPL